MQTGSEVRLVAVNATTGVDWASGPDYSVTVGLDLALGEVVIVDIVRHKEVGMARKCGGKGKGTKGK